MPKLPDTTKGLLVLGSLVALFAWSVWAGLAASASIAAWIGWIVGREALGRRALRRNCRAQLERALAECGLALDAVFHSHHGVAAFGIAVAGQKLAYASADGSELYDLETIFEAKAGRLAQGDYKIGVSVPGRVSGKPYWQELIVARRADALRWVDTLKPCLGPRLKVDGLD